jgi:hypothetical protein
LPSLLEPLHLPALRCAPGWLLALTWVPCGPLTLQRFRPRCTGSMCHQFFLCLLQGFRCSRLLQSL